MSQLKTSIAPKDTSPARTDATLCRLLTSPHHLKSAPGFTLIELLVVLAIIGILATSVMSSISDAKGLALDATRLADMRSINQALQAYFIDNMKYPDKTKFGHGRGMIIGIGDDIDNILSQYMTKVPKDPQHDGTTYFYSYDPEHQVVPPDTPNPAFCSDVPAQWGPNNTQIVYGFNKASKMTNLPRATCAGGDANLWRADFNAVPGQ